VLTAWWVPSNERLSCEKMLAAQIKGAGLTVEDYVNAFIE
jgi:hypothetical protein